jgi:hypothetical protein
MNRSVGNWHRPVAGESRMDRPPPRPASANRYQWRAAEVAAFTADPRRHGRYGNPARSAEPARLAIPLPGRAQALRAKNARSAPHPARTAAADFPGSAADVAARRSPAATPAASPAVAPWYQSRRSGPKENHGHHQ